MWAVLVTGHHLLRRAPFRLCALPRRSAWAGPGGRLGRCGQAGPTASSSNTMHSCSCS